MLAMLEYLGLNLPAVVGQIDALSLYELGRGDAAETRPDQINVHVLRLGVGRLAAWRHRVEAHRVPRVRCYVKAGDLWLLGRRRCVNRADRPAIVLAVVARGADARPDDAALGEPLARRRHRLAGHRGSRCRGGDDARGGGGGGGGGRAVTLEMTLDAFAPTGLLYRPAARV